MVDEALGEMSARFDEIYPEDGRRSIPPERLLRALLLQMLYSIRSERMLMEQLEYNLLFRWFVGLSAWHELRSDEVKRSQSDGTPLVCSWRSLSVPVPS